MRGPRPIRRASSIEISSNWIGGCGSAMGESFQRATQAGKRNAPGTTARGTGELDSLCERVHRNSADIVSKELAANCKAGLQLTHDPRYRCTIGWSFTIVKASIVSPVMVL